MFVKGYSIFLRIIETLAVVCDVYKAINLFQVVRDRRNLGSFGPGLGCQRTVCSFLQGWYSDAAMELFCSRFIMSSMQKSKVCVQTFCGLRIFYYSHILLIRIGCG